MLFKHGLNVDFLFLLTPSVVLTDFHSDICFLIARKSSSWCFSTWTDLNDQLIYLSPSILKMEERQNGSLPVVSPEYLHQWWVTSKLKRLSDERSWCFYYCALMFSLDQCIKAQYVVFTCLSAGCLSEHYQPVRVSQTLSGAVNTKMWVFWMKPSECFIWRFFNNSSLQGSVCSAVSGSPSSVFRCLSHPSLPQPRGPHRCPAKHV